MILGFAFKNTNTCWTNVSIFLLLLLLLIVVHSGPIYALQGSNLTNKEVNRLIWTGIMILCSPILFCRLNQDTSFSENMSEKSHALELYLQKSITFPCIYPRYQKRLLGGSIYPPPPPSFHAAKRTQWAESRHCIDWKLETPGPQTVSFANVVTQVVYRSLWSGTTSCQQFLR